LAKQWQIFFFFLPLDSAEKKNFTGDFFSYWTAVHFPKFPTKICPIISHSAHRLERGKKEKLVAKKKLRKFS
jgi:hypothetical protein